jgi:hypothetical protein
VSPGQDGPCLLLLLRAQAEDLDRVGGGPERVGDDPTVFERDRGDHGAVELGDEDVAREGQRAVDDREGVQSLLVLGACAANGEQ